MEKPAWLVRSSVYIVQSPFMRLRKDEIELPNGTILPEYYVRETDGFVMVFALTPERQVVLVRQYRYGNDTVALELPAGSRDPDEDPLDCARRELAEETGYEAPRWEHLFRASAEPVRSTSIADAYLALDAVCTREQHLDASEHIEVELAGIDEFITLLRSGGIESMACIGVAYAALDRLGKL